MQINKILVLGAGQMGNGIAHVSAQVGYNVVLCDLNQVKYQLIIIFDNYFCTFFNFLFDDCH